jgi:dUTP pyrophosphatase
MVERPDDSSAKKATQQAVTAPLQVRIRQLPHAAGLALPAYATLGAAGMDLVAAIGADETIILGFGERALVPTGLVLQLPQGHEAQVRPRSGLALKNGLTVLNSPGTVDADYRGEVKVVLICFGRQPILLRRGDRIAQLVVAPVSRVEWVKTEILDTTVRSDRGFGSSGT